MSDPQPTLPPSPEGWEQVKERDHVFGHKCYFKAEVDAAKAASDRQIAAWRQKWHDASELLTDEIRRSDGLESSVTVLSAQVEELDELKVEHALLIEHYNQGERLWGEARIELSDLRGSVDRLMQEKERTIARACEISREEIAESAKREHALESALQQLRQAHEHLKEEHEDRLKRAFEAGFYAFCPEGDGKVYEFSHDAIDEEMATKAYRQWIALRQPLTEQEPT